MLGDALSYGMMVCDVSYDMTIHWMKSQQYIIEKDNEMFQQQHKIGIIGFTSRKPMVASTFDKMSSFAPIAIAFPDNFLKSLVVAQTGNSIDDNNP